MNNKGLKTKNTQQNNDVYSEPELQIVSFEGAPILADSSRCCGWYGMVSHAD